MTKYVHPNVHDKGLEWVRDNVDREVAVAGDPADYAAVAAITVAERPLAPGDFTIAAGDVSGRKISSAAASGDVVDTAGDPTHIVWVDDTNSLLVFKTEETLTQHLDAGLALSWPGLTYESRDPT